MDRCLKDEATAKNFVWNKSKSSSHFQGKPEKPVGGGGGGRHSPLAVGGLIFIVARIHAFGSIAWAWNKVIVRRNFI